MIGIWRNWLEVLHARCIKRSTYYVLPHMNVEIPAHNAKEIFSQKGQSMLIHPSVSKNRQL